MVGMVLNGIRLLRKYDANFAVLSLLTNDSISHLKEIYSTIRKTGANGAKFEVFFLIPISFQATDATF